MTPGSACQDVYGPLRAFCQAGGLPAAATTSAVQGRSARVGPADPAVDRALVCVAACPPDSVVPKRLTPNSPALALRQISSDLAAPQAGIILAGDRERARLAGGPACGQCLRRPSRPDG